MPSLTELLGRTPLEISTEGTSGPQAGIGRPVSSELVAILDQALELVSGEDFHLEDRVEDSHRGRTQNDHAHGRDSCGQ